MSSTSTSLLTSNTAVPSRGVQEFGTSSGHILVVVSSLLSKTLPGGKSET